MAGDHAAGKLSAERDVFFAAWSSEELGLAGATRYLENLMAETGVENLSTLVAAYINLDMVGLLEEKVLITGLASSPIWAREVERRNAVIGLPVATSDDTYLPTVSTPFYLNGSPILSVFTGAHEDYHRPTGTAEKLNYDGLRDIRSFVALVALVARSVANEAENPKYIKVAHPAPQRCRRVSNVFLGTILGPGPIDPASSVRRISFLKRNICAGIVVLIQAGMTNVRGEIRRTLRAFISLRLSGSRRLQIEPLLAARRKPLILREMNADDAGSMGPDPRLCARRARWRGHFRCRQGQPGRGRRAANR